MLSTILGSNDAEKALAFITARESGYPYQIAKFFDANLRSVQKQLERLEFGGVLVSHKVGRTRVYTYNPRGPLTDELQALVREAIRFYPADLRERLTVSRQRPRRSGKPL